MLIVSAVDDSYAPHYATMLDSAWCHNPDARFRLIDCGIAAATRATLQEFARSHEMDFAIVDPNMRSVDGLYTDELYSAATYGRLMVADLFPDEQKALYLDADIVVVGDLSDLWSVNLDGMLVAGVAEPPKHERHQVYINCGVLLMNLPEWRRRAFTEQCLNFIRVENLRLPDQTAINDLAQGAIATIEPRWNHLFFLHFHYLQPMPSIVHYVTHWKPWRYRDAPLAAIYRWHRKRTPWPLNERLPRFRPILRFTAGVILFRQKYWRYLRRALRDRRFANDYLASFREPAAGSHAKSNNAA